MSQRRRDLIAEMPVIEELDRLRSSFRSLRSKGMKAAAAFARRSREIDLKERKEASKEELEGLRESLFSNWENPRSRTSRLLHMRAKHLAWSLDSWPSGLDVQQPAPLEDLKELFHDFLTDPSASPSGNSSHTSGDTPPSQPFLETPVLYAATLLRTQLDEPKQQINQPALLCFYRIVRELYSAFSPPWAIGGATASGQGAAPAVGSSFVASECSRALGHFASLLGATSDLLKELASLETYLLHIRKLQSCDVFGIDPEWVKTEEVRIKTSLAITLSSACGRTLLPLFGHEPNEDPNKALEEIRSLTETTLDAVHGAVDAAISEITTFRDLERKTSSIVQTEGKNHRHILQRMLELTETAHARALTELTRSRDHLKDWKNRKDSGFRSLAGPFAHAEAGIRQLILPTGVHLQQSVFHNLFQIQRDPATGDYHELAFAAAGAGAVLENWSDQLYEEAATRLCDAIDDRGWLLIGHPFHIGERGYQKHATNAQALGAAAFVLQHSAIEPSPTVIRKMLQFFESDSLERDGGIAWARSNADHSPRASLWLTSLSVLALDRITRMLDAKINSRVESYLSVKTLSSDSGPKIDDLMCPDVGLKSAGKAHRTITHDMEMLRGHLVTQRPWSKDTSDSIASAILFGPPGTGKTTLIESLARTTGKPLIEITPTDFVLEGEEAVEKRAKAVMHALSMLTHRVILFDEFDSIIQSRDAGSADRPQSLFEFLTAGMLPRLAELNAKAVENRFVYVLATNYVDRLDRAAIRSGRFDYRRGVYPPDAVSRLCWLISGWVRWREQAEFPDGGADKLYSRIIAAVASTAGVPMAQLCKKKWFLFPRDGKPFPQGSLGSWLADAVIAEPTGAAMPSPPMASTLQEPNVKLDNELIIEQVTELGKILKWDLGLDALVNGKRKKPSRNDVKEVLGPATVTGFDEWRADRLKQLRKTRLEQALHPELKSYAESFVSAKRSSPTKNRSRKSPARPKPNERESEANQDNSK